MAIIHYLDNSRLGLMRPTVRDRYQQLADFASVYPGSIEIDRLLENGGEAWDAELRTKFPRLADFPGIESFRQRLKRSLSCQADHSLLFGTTSSTHIRTIASLLYGPCSRVMTTDLSWTPYRRHLSRFAAKRSRNLVVVPVRDLIERNQWDEAEVCDYLLQQFSSLNCDGLFLTSVSHDGIRLPAANLIKLVQKTHELSFSAIDGSQEFAQVAHAESVTASDFYVTGAHKWLGAYLPLTIGVFGKRGSATRIEAIVAGLLESGVIDDPLLRMTWPSDSSVAVESPSTANVAALLTCDAAISDQTPQHPIESEIGCEELAVAIDGNEWRVRGLHPDLRSRTLIANAKWSQNGRQIRERVARAGLAVTAYDGGDVRVSIPRQGWSDEIAADVASRLLSA